jgi:hypothetical protein
MIKHEGKHYTKQRRNKRHLLRIGRENGRMRIYGPVYIIGSPTTVHSTKSEIGEIRTTGSPDAIERKGTQRDVLESGPTTHRRPRRGEDTRVSRVPVGIRRPGEIYLLAVAAVMRVEEIEDGDRFRLVHDPDAVLRYDVHAQRQ